ncbi:MAG: hypothetical protein J6X33_09895 [Clostridiales bacterium]|nr:hypothetical protein [Clostridiales bacterium]
MSDKRNDRLLLSDTGIPDIFIARYASSLSGDALLLYLWIIMKFGQDGSFDDKDVKKLNLIPESDTDKVMAELVTAGVLIRNDRKFSPADLKTVEVDEYVSARMAKGYVNSDGGVKSDEKQRNVLADSINTTFYQGFMPYVLYRLVDKCLYEYKFEGQVVYKLFEYGRDNRIDRDYLAMERTAADWYKNGYTTCDRLEVFLEKSTRVTKLTKTLGKLMRRRMNDNDISHITKWIMAYDTDEAMLRYAFKANEYKGDIRTTDVEDTLSAWYEAGVTDVASAAVYEEERHKENKSKYSRKKGRAGSSWKTGAEAGISEEAQEPSGKEDNSAKTSSEDHIIDDILDMFGGSDGND